MDFKNLKYLVVGSGFFGSVIAERIAADKKERVLVVEKRGHIGGNSFSEDDPETGIECHVYGTHIFHTSNRAVWEYVNRFGGFNHYRHRVLSRYGGRVYSMPINLATINSFYGSDKGPSEAEEFLKAEASKENIRNPSNLEEKAVSMIGRPLYEAFVRGYTVKQWGTDPKDLPAGIITRLPLRFNYKDDYFDDPWQGIPVDGYGALFDKILRHERIDVLLGTDYFDIRHMVPEDCLTVYTGPLDRFFEYRFGALGWRTLAFEREACPVKDFQGTSVMNYAEASVPYTRIHEFRHLHPERRYADSATTIYREYSRDGSGGSDPYYPINTARDRDMLKLYTECAERTPNTVFGGRLGSYRYLDMDKAIESALSTYDDVIKNRRC